jgi:hypothetical protein
MTPLETFCYQLVEGTNCSIGQTVQGWEIPCGTCLGYLLKNELKLSPSVSNMFFDFVDTIRELYNPNPKR